MTRRDVGEEQQNRRKAERRVRMRNSMRMSIYFGLGMGLAYLSTGPLGLAEPGHATVPRALIMGVLNGVLMFVGQMFLVPKLPSWISAHEEEAIVAELDRLNTLEALEREHDPR